MVKNVSHATFPITLEPLVEEQKNFLILVLHRGQNWLLPAPDGVTHVALKRDSVINSHLKTNFKTLR